MVTRSWRADGGPSIPARHSCRRGFWSWRCRQPFFLRRNIGELLELRAGQTAVCDRNVGVGPSMWRRWPVFTQALQLSGPVVARSALPGVRIPGGSRSQDYGSNRSSSSAKLPSSTRSSAPPGASSNIVLFGAQRSIRCPRSLAKKMRKPALRLGVDLDRSTLAGWVGGACWWLDALYERQCARPPASPSRSPAG
jgi:hypothetical protein